MSKRLRILLLLMMVGLLAIVAVATTAWAAPPTMTETGASWAAPIADTTPAPAVSSRGAPSKADSLHQVMMTALHPDAVQTSQALAADTMSADQASTANDMATPAAPTTFASQAMTTPCVGQAMDAATTTTPQTYSGYDAATITGDLAQSIPRTLMAGVQQSAAGPDVQYSYIVMASVETTPYYGFSGAQMTTAAATRAAPLLT